MKQLITILLILTFALTALADWLDPSELATDAATIGIGSIEGFSNSSAAIFQNPAGLTSVSGQSISAFKTTIMDDTDYSNLAIAYRSQWGVIGLGIVRLSVADIAETGVDQFGEYESIANQNYSSSAYFASFAPYTDDYSLGYSLKYFSSQFGSLNGSAINADIGVLIPNFVYKGLTLSAAAKNVLSINKFNFNDDTSLDLPLKIVLGGKYKINDTFQLYSQLAFLKTQQPVNTKAFGIKVSPSFLSFLALTAGWHEQLAGNTMKNSLTLGLALTYRGVTFDYAYEKSEYFLSENNHYMSLAINL